MNTIALNTMTGAVTEYTGFGFQSITPTHAGSSLGLYALQGDTDNGMPIVSTVETGKTEWGSSLKKMVTAAFLALKTQGSATFTVTGESSSHTYIVTYRGSGQARATPGRGIRENYLAFGFSNPDGSDFQLDRIEVEIAQSKNRRT